MAKRSAKRSEEKMETLFARIPTDVYRELGKAKYEREKSIQVMVAEALRAYLSMPNPKPDPKTPRPKP